MATITMSLEEHQELQAKITAANNEAEKWRLKATDLRVEALQQVGATDVDRLTQLVKAALTITTFAAGNLPPEVTKNWPVEALETVANNLDALPTFDINDMSLRVELLKLAQEARDHNIARAKRDAAKTEIAPEA